MMMATLAAQWLALAASLGGLVSVNIIDMALFNSACINACDRMSPQYLNLIMVVFGTVGSMTSVGVILLIEMRVMSESREINIYMENRA
jgi:hypothetical protein